MPPTNPNREALHLLRREPTLLPMELLWRWSLGLGVLALAFFAWARVRPALMFSADDIAGLRALPPVDALAALLPMIADAMPLMARALAEICAPAAVLWIASATLGRGLVTRVLMRRIAADTPTAIAPDRPRWLAFAALNFARVMMLLILVIGYFGGGLIAAIADPQGQRLATDVVIVFVAQVCAFGLWGYVNWVLSLAPVFVVRDGLGPLDAIVAAIAFIGRRRPELVSIATANGLQRTLLAVAVSIISLITVFLPLPAAVIIALLVLQTLVYFVVADMLKLARLGAYATVAIGELQPSSAEAPASSDNTP